MGPLDEINNEIERLEKLIAEYDEKLESEEFKDLERSVKVIIIKNRDIEKARLAGIKFVTELLDID